MKKLRISANTITALRIAGTIGLVFLTPFSTAFFAVYALTGVTDVLDGWVARRTHTATAGGAMLDSVADLFFYSVMLLKLRYSLWELLPRSIWWAVGAILLIRLCAYGTAAVKYRRWASLHTYLNKLTGAAVFLLPFFLRTPVAAVYGWTVCGIAAAASIEEWLIHCGHESYASNVKTILKQKRCKS